MSVYSVHTNEGAIVALAALRNTNSALQSTEKQVSTGYAVNDATDNGPAYSIAQSLRGSAVGIAAANVALGSAQGLLSTTLSGLTSASNELASMKALLVYLAAGTSGTTSQTAYVADYATDLNTIKSFFTDSTYGGKTLLSNYAYYSSGFGSFGAVKDEYGRTFHVGYYCTSQTFYNLCMPNVSSGTRWAAFAASGGTFDVVVATIGKWLTEVGDQVTAINNMISFNSSRIDALDSGIGSLVDADLAAESAMLTSLQVRQQLAEQALSIANATPSTLLTLFR